MKICKIIKTIDSVLKDFGFPTFYKDPKPHVTIGWTLDNLTQNGRSGGKGSLEEAFLFFVSKIVCKIAKWTYEIPLREE